MSIDSGFRTFIENNWKTELSETNFQKVIRDKRIALISFLIFILLGLVVAIVTILVNNVPDDQINTLKGTILSLITFSIILLVLFVLALLLLHKVEKITLSSDNSHTQFPAYSKDIVDDLMSLMKFQQFRFKNNFEDIEKIAKNIIYKFPDNQSFVNKLVEITKGEVVALSRIKGNIDTSFCGRYSCVLLVSEYDKDKEYMIKYFLSFYETIHTNKNNQISRIFPLPVKTEERITTFNEMQCKTFLSYVLINMIAGINTFVLDYDEEILRDRINGNKENIFFNNIDYVIAEKCNINNEKQETELYFSYKNEGATEPQTFRTKDICFINIFQKDFYNQLKYEEHGHHRCLRVSWDNNMYKTLLNRLNINRTKEIEILTSIQKILDNGKQSHIKIDEDIKIT